MATITYDSIKIYGIDFEKIISLEIKQSIDEHSIAIIKGEVSEATAGETSARLTDTSFESIITSAENQPH